MYKHIEFMKLKDFADGCDKETNALRLKVVAESFVRKRTVEGLIKLEVGISEIESEVDVVIYSEFETDEARRDYVRHPSRVANLPTFWDLTESCADIHYEVSPDEVLMPNLLKDEVSMATVQTN